MKKICLIAVMIIMVLSVMAEAKLHNMDTPDGKSDWYNNDAIMKNPFKTPMVLLDEDFEGGAMPAGWEIVPGNPTYSWTVASSFSNGSYPANHGTYFACFDPYTYGYFAVDTEGLYTPAAVVSYFDSLMVRYDFSMQDYAGNGDFNVYVRTFDGSWSGLTQLVNHTLDLVSSDTFNLTSYLPADSVEIYFEYIMDGSTAWGVCVDNVEISGNFETPNYDVKAVSVIEPANEVIIPPTPFMPEIDITNTGIYDMPDVFVYCEIDDTAGNVYMDTVFIDTVNVGDTLNIQFNTFSPDYIMDYDMTAYVDAALDSYPPNNEISKAFRTYDADMKILSHTPGSNNMYFNDPYIISGTYYNNATVSTGFTAYCNIWDNAGSLIYSDELYISSIAPAETLIVEFDYFNSSLPLGTYAQETWCEVNYDIDTGNDTLSDNFTVMLDIANWTDMGVDSTIQPIQWPGVCQDESSIWIIGGYSSATGVLDNVQRYDTVNGWSLVTHVPSGLIGCAAAIIDSKLYVIGGDNASFTAYDTTYIYDIAADTWSYGTPIPEPRGVMAGGVYQGKMYLIGGSASGATDTHNPNYCYNPKADTTGGSPWDTMTPYPNGTSSLSCGTNFFGAPASVNAPIICGGSYQGDTTFYMYNPPADTAGGSPWTNITQLNSGEMGTKAPLIIWDNNYAYLVGGDTYGSWSGSYLGKTHAFEYSSSTWIDMSIVQNYKVEGSGGGIIGDYIYTAGGTTGSGGIYPAPFERTYRKGKAPVSEFIITYTYPINRQINAPVDEEIIVAFSEPVDTSLGFSYTVNPDPGLLTHFWSGTFDTLYIYHDYLDIDETYYVEIAEAYNDSGIALADGNIPNPFGFNTGLTGINENNMYAFSLKSRHDMGSSSVSFDYILPTEGNITIDIYNITGSKVKSLTMVDQSTGYHTVSWNSDIASGVYLYRAVYGDRVVTGKMEIIK